MKTAISGPGRSGTSIVLQLFGAWGFSVPADEWFRTAEAGLESRLGIGSPFEIDKDPWAYEYISGIDLSEYDFVLIPLRDRLEATTSRSTQQRFAAATSVSDDRWKWRTGGSVPGGAVVKQNREAISESVSEDLSKTCYFEGPSEKWFGGWCQSWALAPHVSGVQKILDWEANFGEFSPLVEG